MKLSLAPVSCLALLVLGGCSSTKDDEPAAEQPPQDTPVEAPPPSNVRKLVEMPAQPTSPVNLLTDPGFMLTSDGASYVGFLAFEDESSAPYEIKTTVDSRSPAGLGGEVAIVTTTKAVIVVARVPGGQGPFHAQTWVSRSDTKGRPSPADGPAPPVKASLADEAPEGDKAYDLAPVEAATKTVGGRTWVLLRANVSSPLPYGGFLVLRVDGNAQLAAPEVTSDEIVAGAAVKSRALASVPARGLRAHERAAIERFRTIKPSLVPAAPKRVYR